jgi:chlorophyll synthase
LQRSRADPCGAAQALSIGGSFISYIYSAPPLKLKQSGWIGNYALGSSYIALPW